MAKTNSDNTYSDGLVATKILSLNLLVTIFKLLATILFADQSIIFCSGLDIYLYNCLACIFR